MAWDLWSSPFGQVVRGCNYFEHPEWQCDFYFGCERDVIEEDALNEKSCVEVLRILITKADTEIEGLEKDLLSLQNELAWAEHEKWPEICCSALTDKINLLGLAISTLKNEHADDTEMRLLLQNKPAETLPEIVKALQRDHCQDTYGQHLDVNILTPSVNATEQALDKESSKIDSNILIQEEGKELCGTSENSTSSKLLLELDEKSSNEPEEIEELLAQSLVRRPDLGAITCIPSHSDGMKLLGTSNMKVTGNEEVRSQLITTDTGQVLNSFSSKGKGNIPREGKQENAIVKSIKGRKKCLDSRLGASQQRKSGNSDLDQKLRDFAPKTARRTCKKESKVAPAEDLDSMNIPLQVVYPEELRLADTELCSYKGSNSKNYRRVMNIQNASLIHAENYALISLLEMQTESAPYTGSQLTNEEKPQAQGLKCKIVANLSKSNMSFPSQLGTQGKRKSELEAFSTREPHDSSVEVIPNTSITITSKRQRKSRIRTDGVSLNESMNRKTTKRAVQPGRHESEEGAIVLYDSKFSELQQKRRVSKLPLTMEIENSTVNLDIPNSDMVSMDNGSQVDLQISKSYSLVDSHNETSALLPISLKSLKLSNLRAIAKQHNVRKYYKLAKGALVEQLVERLSSC